MAPQQPWGQARIFGGRARWCGQAGCSWQSDVQAGPEPDLHSAALYQNGTPDQAGFL